MNARMDTISSVSHTGVYIQLCSIPAMVEGEHFLPLGIKFTGCALITYQILYVVTGDVLHPQARGSLVLVDAVANLPVINQNLNPAHKVQLLFFLFVYRKMFDIGYQPLQMAGISIDRIDTCGYACIHSTAPSLSN